jgi:hypothetical protein
LVRRRSIHVFGSIFLLVQRRHAQLVPQSIRHVTIDHNRIRKLSAKPLLSADTLKKSILTSRSKPSGGALKSLSYSDYRQLMRQEIVFRRASMLKD